MNKLSVAAFITVLTVLSSPAATAQEASPADPHLNNLFESWSEAPAEVAILTGLERQMQAAEEHAAAAAGAESLETTRQELQRTLNVLVGQRGKEWDEGAGGASDGFGVLAYLEVAVDQVEKALDSVDDEAASTHGYRTLEALQNTVKWSEEAVRHAGYGLSAPKAEGASLHAGHVVKWLKKAVEGSDENYDGTIGWKEGGFTTALSEARQLR